jgi:hypothetical protein
VAGGRPRRIRAARVSHPSHKNSSMSKSSSLHASTAAREPTAGGRTRALSLSSTRLATAEATH